MGSDTCSNIDGNLWNNYYGFLAGSNEDLIGALGYDHESDFNMYNGLTPYLSQGSLTNHQFVINTNDPRNINILEERMEYDNYQWGKILPYGDYTHGVNTLPNPILGHTPRLEDTHIGEKPTSPKSSTKS